MVLQNVGILSQYCTVS